MKQLFIQAYNLMRQNRFYTVINVIGTAVTIAFIMVVVMMYDFRISDISPESDRSRYVYSNDAITRLKDSHTDVNTYGIGRIPFEMMFEKLNGVKDITWYSKISKSIYGLPNSKTTYNYFVRPVASNWFSFFDYKFIDGRPITKEEYDSRRWVCVLTKKIALALFGTTDVVGKDMQISFNPVRIVGVIEDVNSIFQTAYADAFIPFSVLNEDYQSKRTDGIGGLRYGVLKLDDDADKEQVKAEISRREKMVNNLDARYELKLDGLYDHVQYTFFRGKDVNASLIYGAQILMLLIVPAVNISGLTHAQIQKRDSEIALRKAYGASNLSILSRLFSENLLTIILGGFIGYAISCIIMFICRSYILGSGEIELSSINFSNGIPALIVCINIMNADLTVNTLMDVSLSRFAICFTAAFLLIMFMILLGIIFPAIKAMDIEPAEALHEE